MRRTGERGRLARLDRRRQQLGEALVAIRDWMKWQRLRRLERRGDVVLRWSEVSHCPAHMKPVAGYVEKPAPWLANKS